MSATVVLVHGLWMTGADMTLLRRRLRRCGFHTLQFRYQSLRVDPDTVAAALADYLQRLQLPCVHLVGHSLGGLVIHKALTARPGLPVGRVVTLGTPHLGSGVAQALAGTLRGRVFLGRAEPLLCAGAGPWQMNVELGVVAGTLSMGVGRLFGALPEPNDGTVTVAETRVPGARELLTLPLSHMALLVSREAASAVCGFLQHGRFAGVD